MKYYTYWQESMFREFNLTPEKVRQLPVTELVEYSHFLFRYNNLVDMRDLFSHLADKVGSNRIIDKHTKQDMMDRFVKYFVNYTVPFMDTPHLVNNFIRENDVVKYLANRFDEPNSFETVMELAMKYGDRTFFHEYILDALKKYQLNNFNQLPSSYSAKNVKKIADTLKEKVKTGNVIQPTDKTYEILMAVMKYHGMVNEMQEIPCSAKNHYITDAICGLKSDGNQNFYSNQVQTLFPTKEDKNSDLYAVSMIKALLKEGDTESALRVLDENERAQTAKIAAIQDYYIKVFDHIYNNEDKNIRKVGFLPDVLKEREERIKKEIEQASLQSEYSKKKLIEKYDKISAQKNLPMSYSDFKKKHFGLVKTLKNQTQQLMLMKMVKAAVADCDYDKINTLFDYLLVNKEEEQLRDNIRKKIDAFEKIYDPEYLPQSPQEAEHPLRVLLRYIRKPKDDIDTLVNKYILLVPDLQQKLNKIKDRKEFLHKNIRNMIKERDAMFMTSSTFELVSHFDKKAAEELSMANVFSDQHLDKIQAVFENFAYLDSKFPFLSNFLGPITDIEEKMNLTEEQITKARLEFMNNPDKTYEQVIAEVLTPIDEGIEDAMENILGKFSLNSEIFTKLIA